MKIDLKKEQKHYYSAKKKPELQSFDVYQYLAVVGQGSPDGQEFSENIASLYQVAYQYKGIYKALDKDFTVPKLEGFWWVDAEDYQAVPKELWHYRIVIKMPDFVDMTDLETVKAAVIEKKNREVVRKVERYESKPFTAVQILHVGPFKDEPATLAVLHAFIKDNQYAITGLHQEIYLSDFRKTAPENLKTILRYPVEKRA